jgi:DNA excision repair protein ERCC-2
LPVFIEDRIATHFKGRSATYAAVANSIAAVTASRRGNYLIFFPSYKYLEAVLEIFQSLAPEIDIIVQRSGMNESERERFIANFEPENDRTLAGFAVMGGVFGEGIDLVGDRLAGAVVVGVGLPQISVERDLIARYFTALGTNGFNYGYVFPGMNRVLQAVGRVIRSETDRGVALLIDERFSRWPYRELLPKWWDLKPLAGRPAVREFIEAFWNASSD